MSEYIGRFTANKLTKKGFQDYFIHEVFDLLNDSDIQVWLESMEIAVNAMERNFFLEEQFEFEVAPCFLKHLQPDYKDNQSDLKLSKILGRYIHFMPHERHRQDSLFRKSVLRFLKRLSIKDRDD